jgi:hypothetical protein
MRGSEPQSRSQRDRAAARRASNKFNFAALEPHYNFSNLMKTDYAKVFAKSDVKNQCQGCLVTQNFEV